MTTYPKISRRLLWIARGLCAVCFLALVVSATAQEAAIVPNSIIVVFHDQTLPADAAARVQRAGGTVVSTMDNVGVLVARPANADSASLIRNLRKDNAILDADYDRMLWLIAPNQVAPETSPITQDDVPHPGPTFSSSLPADFFYTSSPQQWAVKRVGAQGGGIAGGSNGAWDITKGAGVKIAILDTGVNPEHPDVSGNLIFNATFTSYDPPSLARRTAKSPILLIRTSCGTCRWTRTATAPGRRRWRLVLPAQARD